MSAGYIKLFRSIQDNPIWTRHEFSDGQAWVDLLLLAPHKVIGIKIRGVRIEVPRGTVAWSEISLANRWKWSRGRVRRFLQKMVQENMIEIVQQKGKLTTLIKIINYDNYQSDGTTDGTTEQTRNEQQTDNRNLEYKGYNNNNKVLKKNNNKKENKITVVEPLFNLPDWVDKETWAAFELMRKKKWPMTNKARELVVKELDKLRLEGHDHIEVLNQSIRNNYRDVYPLKKSSNITGVVAPDSWRNVV